MRTLTFIFSVFVFYACFFMQTSAQAIAASNKVIYVDDEYNKFRQEGDEFFKQGNYKKARKKYLSCLEVPGYSADTYAKNQIALCDKAINAAEGNDNNFENSQKKSPALKIAVGALGLGSGLYALKLNGDWNSKISAIDKAKQSGDNTSYQTAYNDAAQFQSSQGLRNICVSVAVAAVVAEVFLFVRKPKPAQPKISISPAASSIGFALNYKF